MPLPNHGANPHNVYQQLGLTMPEVVYDFSENVNAAGPPSFVEARWRTFYPLIQRYPDPDGEPFNEGCSFSSSGKGYDSIR